MRFEILYLLAKLRGKFLKENWKFNVRCGTTSKKDIKAIFNKNDWIPYRIEKTGTGFITK